MDLVVPERCRTSRLVLRKPRLDDAGALFRAYTQDEEVVRFVTWRAHQSEADTLEYLKLCLRQWSTGSSFPYAIELPGSADGPVGMIDLRRGPHDMQFGYIIARPYWGQGYMTEALSHLVDWSLEQPGIWRASSFCDVENLASARVMEKAGMAFEGILRRHTIHPNISAQPRDCRLYAKVRV